MQTDADPSVESSEVGLCTEGRNGMGWSTGPSLSRAQTENEGLVYVVEYGLLRLNVVM